jgi:sugar phosphate isomerase/epimerase
MNLGIFAKTFPRRTFDETLDAVASHGLHCIQFNFSCVGLPTLPEVIEPQIISKIRDACAGGTSSTSPILTEQSGTRGARPSIDIIGVSGTFNMIDPDVGIRRERLTRLAVLAKATRELGCDVVTLCTGTRDPEDMWRAHPENNSPQAWRDLLGSMEKAIAIAEQHDVLVGVEPETSNVVSSVRKARQLLDELHSSRVKIVLDPANFFHRGHVERIRETIEEAFQLLGTDIVMAHAKELAADGSTGTLAPGQGVLDWNYYFNTLAQMNFRRPIVMHGLTERDVSQSIRFLRAKLWE